MIMVPIFMNIRILKNNKKKLKIFIPLVLIWILLFALLIALAPFVLISSVILWRRGYGKTMLITYPMLFSLICSLSGLSVQIEKMDKNISILIK